MMFKKKESQVERYWENEDYMKIRTLNQINELNESQKRLKMVDGGEYENTRRDIARHLQQLESKYAFDEMMGDPLEKLDGMFNE